MTRNSLSDHSLPHRQLPSYKWAKDLATQDETALQKITDVTDAEFELAKALRNHTMTLLKREECEGRPDWLKSTSENDVKNTAGAIVEKMKLLVQQYDINGVACSHEEASKMALNVKHILEESIRQPSEAVHFR